MNVISNNSYRPFKSTLSTQVALIATDGSKSSIKTAVAAINFTNHRQISGSIDTYSSNNTAEVIAIILALKNFITGPKNYFILTDSLSVLRALKSKKARLSISICDIKSEIQDALEIARTIILIWVPGHKGIEENEKADKLAKRANDEIVFHWIPEVDIREEKKYAKELLSELETR